MNLMYKIVEKLILETFKLPEDQVLFESELLTEIKQIQRKLSVLPTSRESEALPELNLILQLSKNLISQNSSLPQILLMNQKLEKTIVEEVLDFTCSAIIKAKIYNNKEIVIIADQIFSNSIIYGTKQIKRERNYNLQMINTILDKSADYYKSNGKESANSFPFGEPLEIDSNVRKLLDDLQPGQQIDCVKYVSGKRIWSRAIFERNEYSMLKVEFINDKSDSFIHNKYFEIAPFKSRSLDFEWRQNLQVGDKVDIYFLKSDWGLYSILEVSIETNQRQEEVKNIKVQKLNSDSEYDYDLISYVRVQSPIVAEPGRYSGKDKSAVDDSDDGIYLAGEKKKRFAIMRPISSINTSSIFIIKYINYFGEYGGFEYILKIFENKNQIISENIEMFVRILQSSSEYLLEYFVREHGEKIIDYIQTYAIEAAEKNLRNVSCQNLNSIMEGISKLAVRVYSESIAKSKSFVSMLQIILICVKSEYLDKQFFGAKMLNDLEMKTRHDKEGYRKILSNSLFKEEIFERFIKGHPSLIGKSNGALKILFSEGQVTQNQLILLWDRLTKADLESKNALITVVKEIFYDVTLDQILIFANNMPKGFECIDAEIFELLMILEKIALNRFSDERIIQINNDIIWKMIQEQKNISPELCKEIISQFVKSFDIKNGLKYIDQIIMFISIGKNVLRNLKLLIKIIKQEKKLNKQILQEIEKVNLVEKIIHGLIQIFDKTSLKKQKNETYTQNDLIENEEISKSLKLFMSICSQSDQNLFKFEHAEKILLSVIKNNRFEPYLMEWIKNYLTSNDLVNDFLRFFNQNINKLFTLKSAEFSKLFILLFYRINILKENFLKKQVKMNFFSLQNYKLSTINIHILNVPVEKLNCFEDFWKIYLESQDQVLEIMLANFITRIYFPPENSDCFNLAIYENEIQKFIFRTRNLIIQGWINKNYVQCQKGCILLEKMVRREETKGFDKLLSYHSMKPGDKIVLFIEKDVKSYKERFRGMYNETDNLFSIFLKVSKEYKLPLESIQLYKENGEELFQTKMSSTLEQLKFEFGDTLIVKELEIPDIEEVQLLNASGEITEQALLVLKEIFNDFSTKGKMTKVQLANFVSSATDGTLVTLDDERVLRIFDISDQENKGYVLEKDFLGFYVEASKNLSGKINTVRQNLTTLGYGRDLKLKHSQFSNNQGGIRDQLAKDNELNEILIQLNESGYQNVRKLFKFLTPNYDLINKLLQNPIEIVNKHPKLRKYFFTIISAILFKRDEMEFLTQKFKVKLSKEFLERFLKKICDQNFIKLIIENLYLQNFEKLEKTSKKISIELLLFDKILKCAVSLSRISYFEEMKNLSSYAFKPKMKKDASIYLKSLQIKDSENNETKQNKLTQKNSVSDILNVAKEDDEDKEEEENLKLLMIIINPEIFQQFVKNIEFSKLNEILVNILSILVKSNQIDKYGKLVLRRCLTLLLSSLLNDSSQLSILLHKNKIFQDVVFKGLASEKGVCRLYFKNFYSFLTSQSDNVDEKSIFFKLIIENINTEQTDLFVLIELAANLLQEISFHNQTKKDLNKEFQLSKLFIDFSEKLISHSSVEINYDDKEDQLMISYMTLLEKIARADSNILKEMEFYQKIKITLHIFKNCLFEVSSKQISFENIKCKSRKSRNAAQSLLSTIIKYDNKLILLILVTGFAPLQNHIPDFNISSSDFEKKSQYGFLGIKNLGSVCYMIAMLQQFYCVPSFRYGMLMANDGQPELEKIVKGRKFDDNVFHQLQKMFSYLDQSNRKDFNPLDFCLTYKDITGEAVNVLIQQDASEFLNMIFDKLENSVKNSPFKSFLESIFSGKNYNVFTCKGCGFVRSKQELFFNLSLEVKNMPNIHSSFEKFNAEEIISDFLCESCKTKCDVIKRCYLYDLPNVFIIHLQKIIFDLDCLQNVKIQSKYEFPQNINLKQYIYQNEKSELKIDEANKNQKDKIEGQEAQTNSKDEQDLQDLENKTDEDYEYKLVGVVIHKGNAEFGHYISLINVNRQDPNRKNISSDLWLEFDDSKISKFDMSTFEEECFGNQKDEKEIAGFPLSMMFESQFSKSAYVLVYDKVKKSSLKFFFNEQNNFEKEKIINNLLYDKRAYKEFENHIETEFYNINKYIPQQIQNPIEEDNMIAIFEQQVLSNYFPSTFVDILSGIVFPSQTILSSFIIEQEPLIKIISENLLNIIPEYFFKIFFFTSDNFKCNKLILILDQALMTSPEKLLWFFEEYILKNIKNLTFLLTNSNYNIPKNVIADFMACPVLLLIKYYNIKFKSKTSSRDGEPSEKAEAHLVNFYQTIFSLLQSKEQASQNLRKFASVIYLLQKLIANSKEISEYFLTNSMLNFYYDVYMAQESSRIQNFDKSLQHLILIIVHILQSLVDLINQKDSDEDRLKEYFSSFTKIEFFVKILKEDNKHDNYSVLKKLVQVCCFNNLQLSEQLILACLKGISVSIDFDLTSYLECLKYLIQINDKYSNLRFRYVIGEPKLTENKVDSNQNYVFGLRKESYLKRAVYFYPSSFGLERSFLDYLFNFKDLYETGTLMLIYYLFDFLQCSSYNLEYFLKLPPMNYLHSTIYEWIQQYVEIQLKTLPGSNSTLKQEIQILYLDNLEDKLKNFENQARQIIANLIKIDQKDVKVFQTVSSPVNSIFKQYIIGKTFSANNLKNLELDSDDTGSLSLNLILFKVSLMESQPINEINLSIPNECLSYDSFLDKINLKNKNIELFLGQEEIPVEENQTTSHILKIAEDEVLIEKTEKQIQYKETNKEAQNAGFVNNDYILRVGLSNKTTDNYFVKIEIISENQNVNEQQIKMLMRSNRKDLLIQNIVKNKIEESFEGLKIKICYKKTEFNNMKNYTEDNFSKWIMAFEFKDE